MSGDLVLGAPGPRGWVVEVRRVVSEDPYRCEVVDRHRYTSWEEADRMHSRLVEDLVEQGYECSDYGWAGWQRCARPGSILDVELAPEW